jgi:hypothetical protein
MEDMPTPEGQVLVKKAYAGWYALIVALVWNIVTLAAIMFGNNDGPAIGSFILSLIIFIFKVPLSFLTYRLLYNAVR